MLERITINLSSDESLALQASAKKNYRDLRSEARYLIRIQLEQFGLLLAQTNEISGKEDQSDNRSPPLLLSR